MADSGYELVSQPLKDGHSVLVIARSGQDTFLREMAESKRQREIASAVQRAALRLAEYGTTWAIDSESLKMLHGLDKRVRVYELKVKSTVHRVATYVHDDENRTPVLLFYFEAHVQRAAGGIPPSTLRKTERLAGVAERLMRAEEGRTK